MKSFVTNSEMVHKCCICNHLNSFDIMCLMAVLGLRACVSPQNVGILSCACVNPKCTLTCRKHGLADLVLLDQPKNNKTNIDWSVLVSC